MNIKDLAPYLPYNLKGTLAGNSKIYTLVGIDGLFASLRYYDNNEREEYEVCVPLEDFIPILRPMTDLVKPISVKGYNNGAEFIPIIELTKNSNTYKNSKYKLEFSNAKLLGNDFASCEITIDSGPTMTNLFPIKTMHGINLSDLDLLNEWHFDYRGLLKL